MKQINSRLFLALLFAGAVAFTGCSKDKKLERELYKKEGKWNIENFTWEMVVQDTAGQHVQIGSTANAGTFSFDKGGSGSYNFTVNGNTYSQSFSWSVSSEKISITKVSQTVDFSGNFDQLAVAMSGTQSSKDNIQLDGSETHQYSSGGITQKVISGTFYLKKQ